jgi:hypothetical protein
MMPKIISPKFVIISIPEDITPQAYAHIGGNQVMGLISSSTAKGLEID